MKTASFQYKCRLCDEIYIDGHTSEQNAMIILIATIHGNPMPKRFIGTQPDLIGLHSGCKKGFGVSDLIGYVIEG